MTWRHFCYDATEEPDLAKRFDVGGYPTLKFFKNHATEGLEYGGGRTKDEIISWLDKKSGPPAHAINGKYIHPDAVRVANPSKNL